MFGYTDVHLDFSCKLDHSLACIKGYVLVYYSRLHRIVVFKTASYTKRKVMESLVDDVCWVLHAVANLAGSANFYREDLWSQRYKS
jgi:hypothetical protein